MYIKIPVAYLIISYKNWKQNYNSKKGWWSNYSPSPYRNLTWRKTDTNFEEKENDRINDWIFRRVVEKFKVGIEKKSS